MQQESCMDMPVLCLGLRLISESSLLQKLFKGREYLFLILHAYRAVKRSASSENLYPLSKPRMR